MLLRAEVQGPERPVAGRTASEGAIHNLEAKRTGYEVAIPISDASRNAIEMSVTA
jgi:hypothetical protein